MDTHLEPDILEGEVKWALGSNTTNKAIGNDGVPAELFKILKDDVVKVLHSICQQIWKTQHRPMATGLEKVSFHSNPKERQCQRMFKLLHNCAYLTHASKAVLKILQVRLHQNMNWELPDIQTGFRKVRGTRDQIANIHWIIEKATVLEKLLLLLYWLYQSLWLYGSQQTVENSSRDGNTRPPDLPPEKSVGRSRSNS